jgi:sugar lactone lactonase YvrE
MKIFTFIRRQIAPVVVMCCLIGVGSQPAQAQTGETIYISTFTGNQILKVVDAASPTITVINTDAAETPENIVVGPDGKIYICDADQNRIRRMNQDGSGVVVVYDKGTSTTLPGGSEGPSFNTLGDLYFNTRGTPGTHTGIWKITSTQLSGSLPVTPTNVVTAAQTGSTFGEGTTFDATDQLLFVDRSGGKVWRFNTATSTLVTTALITGLSTPIGIAVNGAGDIFVANFGTNSVKHYDTNGNPASVPDFVTFTAPDSPTFLKFDASGNLFVVTVQAADASGGKLWRVSPSGTVTQLAGLGSANTLNSPNNYALGLGLPPTSPPSNTQPLVGNGVRTTFSSGNAAFDYQHQYPADVSTPSGSSMTVTTTIMSIADCNALLESGSHSSPYIASGTTCVALPNTGGNAAVFTAQCVPAGTCPSTTGFDPFIGAPHNAEDFIHKIRVNAVPVPPSCPRIVTTESDTTFNSTNEGAAGFYDITTGAANGDPTGGGRSANSRFVYANLPTCTTASTDTIPPTTTATTFPASPNSLGWFTTSPVRVVLTSVDDATAMPPGGTLVNNNQYMATGAQTISPTTVFDSAVSFLISGIGVTTITYFATDNAGKAEVAKTLVLQIDPTSPTATITSPTATTYTVNQPVASSYACTDPDDTPTCVGPVASGANIDTSAGSHTFTVTATDRAGNTGSASVTYTVSYNVCILYDPSHAVKSGAVIPLKMYLCDANGNDLSNSGIIVNAFKLVQVSSGATDTIVDAGNANPDNNFRFDPSLGPTSASTGGFIFNLKANLMSGTYDLYFTAGNDPSTNHFLQFQVR